MNQTEAVHALGRFLGVDDCAASQEYLRLMSENVAALASTETESFHYLDKPLVEQAIKLTHATIQSLVTGAKEGGE